MLNNKMYYVGWLLAIGFVLLFLRSSGLLNGRGLAITFAVVMTGYIIYLFGYSEGNKDGLSGKNEHPPEDNKYR